MSGGVDSAVAALLERERGAEVVGITVKLWADPETDGAKACCSPEAVLGARGLAHSLGIPHFTLDLEEEFRRRVVGRFVSGYAEGSTPNPCVLCNGEVRLAAMIDLAERLGAERLLTGHYARIVEDADGPLLASAADEAKDQSYMLAALPPELLGRLGFPLTELTKPEVREIAARHGLAVARKAESQDLCFLAGQGKRGFLRRHGGLEDRDGAVLDRSGRAVGRHRGHHNFTVGQRRGIGVSAPEPLYVIATDAAANTVTVGTREELETRRVSIRDAILHRDGARVDAVRLRYHSRALPASIGTAGAGRHEALEVELGERVRRRLAGPDGGAAGGRDDRRPRHDRRAGLAAPPSAAATHPHSVCEIFRLPHMKAQEIRDTYLSFFERARAQDRPLGLAGARRPRPLGAAHDRRDAAVQALLPRPRKAAGAAPRRRPEMLPHHRHRGGRQHRPPPDLLRDARQLELRRLLQGRSRSPGAGSSRPRASGWTRSGSG